MASTITLQQTINFALPFLQYRPVTISNNEPAITIANIVKQTILGPPFRWKWNRASLPAFNVTQATQDYVKPISDFGFIEEATVNGRHCDSKLSIGYQAADDQGRPGFCAPLIDDGAGNITFRFLPVPDGTYSAVILYQKKPTLFTALSDTWSPIPDEYSFIYQYGFLTLAMAFADDNRFTVYSQKFAASLISSSEGLDEQEKSAFMSSWNSITSTTQASGLRTQQGFQARSL